MQSGVPVPRLTYLGAKKKDSTQLFSIYCLSDVPVIGAVGEENTGG